MASNIQKKELEELRAGFAAEKEELKEDYQKQVDEMFFFGYQCCMRKNDMIFPTTFMMRKMQLLAAPPREIRIQMLLGPSTGSDCTLALSFSPLYLYCCT